MGGGHCAGAQAPKPQFPEGKPQRSGEVYGDQWAGKVLGGQSQIRSYDALAPTGRNTSTKGEALETSKKSPSPVRAT
jgi:hypothetical protein